jgi:DNA-binding beta-propeller fold protein YncE
MRLANARRLAAALVAAIAGLASPAHAADAPMRDVMAIGNNWDGTAHIVDAYSFKVLMHVNIVPDLEERRLGMLSNPYYVLVRQVVGEGHDQLVDDMFTSRDGRQLYVSRPSLSDVVAIDLATRKIAWRVAVDGNRSDHMAISSDGARLLVSASTANVVDVIDTAKGRIVAKFPSGDSPHESNFSADDSRVFHASIGRVYAPTTDKASDMAKGKKIFEIVDARTWQVLSSFDLNDKLAEFGRPDIDGTIRPMAVSPDERYAYFQTSFHHGFVEYDFQQGKVTRALDLPARTQDYVLNSAHHGLAMNHDGTKLCAAGTIDDYVAIVHRDTFSSKLIDTGDRPYWATDSADGKLCFVSIAEDDYVSVVSYDQEKEVAKIPVGRHPQRIRAGKVLTAIVGAPESTKASRAPRLALALKTRTLPRARRRATLVLTSSERITKLNARLRRNGRTYARGNVARLDGRATLTLRVRRALRRGSYRLLLDGLTAGGQRARRTIAVRVR